MRDIDDCKAFYTGTDSRRAEWISGRTLHSCPTQERISDLLRRYVRHRGVRSTHQLVWRCKGVGDIKAGERTAAVQADKQTDDSGNFVETEE